MWRPIWIGVLLAAGCRTTPDPLETQRVAWREARREGTVEALMQFVAAHPESGYAPEARERAAYLRAMEEESPEALDRLLREYPEGRYYDRENVERWFERRMYWRAVGDPGGAAAEAYLERWGDGEQGRRVLERLRRERFEQAKRAGTAEALARFAARFPDHALTQEALDLQAKREAERRCLTALARARTVHLSIDYRPPPRSEDRDRRPPWLEEELVAPVRTFLRHAGLRAVGEDGADVRITIRIRTDWIPMRYWGGAQVFVPNAGLELTASIEVHAGDDAFLRRQAEVREEPPDQKIFLQRDDQPLPTEMVLSDERRLDGLVARAETVKQLALVLVEARGIELLFPSLQDDSADVWTRAKAILEDLAREDSIAPLRERLHDERVRVAFRAVQALEGWWSPGEDADERERLAFQLFQSTDPPLPTGFGERSLPLASAVLLATEPGLWGATDRAVAVLESIGTPAVEVLIAAFDTPGGSIEDSRTRAIAAALHGIGDSAVEPLLSALDHPHPAVREAAAFTLGLLRPPAALAALERVAASDLDSPRRAAADAVARILVDPLIERLDSPDPGQRQEAVFQLRGIDEPRVLAAFSTALEDENLLVRRQVIDCLRWSEAPSAVDLLIQALADPNASARKDAALALGRVGHAGAVEPLITLLADPDRLAREAAAWALGRLGDARSIAPLRTLSRDPVDEVRERAREALQALGAAPADGTNGP